MERRSSAKTFIWIEREGPHEEVERWSARYCREALWVLAACKLILSSRNHVSLFGLEGDVAQTTSSSILVSKTSTWISGSWQKRGALISEDLNKLFFTASAHLDLDRILDFWVDPALSQPWKLKMWRAAALVGRSHQAQSLSDAFLYQMFALETLLLRGDSGKGKTLAARLRGLLGASPLVGNTEELYRTRNRIVHEGDASSLTAQMLFVADQLASNVLRNLCLHRSLFQDQPALIHFAGTPEAKRTGLKRFCILHRRFDPKEYELPMQ
jgi:hypothetical protein